MQISTLDKVASVITIVGIIGSIFWVPMFVLVGIGGGFLAGAVAGAWLAGG